MPKLDALRQGWFEHADVAGPQEVCRRIQQTVFDEVAFYPLGKMFLATASKTELTGMQDGFVQFWNLKRG